MQYLCACPANLSRDFKFTRQRVALWAGLLQVPLSLHPKRDFALHIPNPSKSASYARTFSALPLGVGTPDLLAAGLVAVVCPGGGASPV